MSPPLVTICVPTYDRAGHVEQLLASLADEIGTRTDVVVLVSDNASPDRTPEVLRDAAARHPWLRVARQPSNLGMIGNLRWLVANAPASEFLWLFGDDDLLLPGRLDDVLAVLRAERPAWLHLPHRWRENGEITRLSPAPGRVERLATSTELHRAYHHWLGLISAAVVRADLLREAVDHIVSDNIFCPMVWFFRAGAGGPCVVMPDHVLDESMHVSWEEQKPLYLTLHYTDTFDVGLREGITAEAFARSLDQFYEDWALQFWRPVPLAELAERVRRFPTSESLRSYLWTLAVEQGVHDVLDALADERREDEARDLVSAGEEAYAAGRVIEAAGLFERATRLAPTLVEAWNDLAVVQHHLGRRAEAGEAIGHALFLAPDDADALANRDALLAVQRGAWAPAEAASAA